MEFFVKFGTMIRIHPHRTIQLWWNGEVRADLLTFDDAGYRLIFESLGGLQGLQQDVVRNNIKIFLNDWLSTTRYDFDKDGPISLEEPKVKRLLRIP